MKKYLLSFLILFYSTMAFADVDYGSLLNKVSLNLQVQQWVTTKTALVIVGINAAVADQGIANVQATVLNKLKQLSDKGEWHVMSFNRQQDQSGLESIRITAQARLPQDQLSGLRDKAKSITKPGETYNIDDVQFVPSDDELKQAMISLRNDIYTQVKNEIDALNKTYPDQKYYVYSIDFGIQPTAPMAANMMAMEKSSLRMAAAPIAVGNKMELQATVVIAAMPEVVSQKLGQ